MLHKDKVLEDFTKDHDVFSRKLYFDMESPLHHKLSPQSQKIIQSFRGLYIKFLRFTYLRGAGFDDETIHLPKFSLDCFVLVQVARQLVAILNTLLVK